MNLSGHFWTIAPTLKHGLLNRGPGDPLNWSTTLEDPAVGPITLRGALRLPHGARTCLVIVHGLGGVTDAFYCQHALAAADAQGLASLRLSLRGADRQGEDFYHGGLVADLEAAVRSRALAQFERLIVLGYSLGGHMALRYGLAPNDPRVQAVAAICPPLELGRTADAIHRPNARIYERAILTGLQEIYAAVAARKPVPTPLARVARVTSLREWDELTVVPRFGFADADAYYREMSVGPHLSELQRPALIVHSDADPIIPPHTFEDRWLARPSALTWCRTHAGGHVAFPRETDLGLFPGPPGTVESQVVRWLVETAAARA